jgi:hypothetical protein
MSIQSSTVDPIFFKPKILLIDCDSGIGAMLHDLGLNLSRGSLGRPCTVPRTNELRPVVGEFAFPNASEQEIVIVDFSSGPLLDQPRGSGAVSEFEEGWWAKCLSGVIDPRPLGASLALPLLRPAYSHGAVFIIFAACPSAQDFVLAVRAYERGPVTSRQAFKASMWLFIDALQYLGVTSRSGEEMVADTTSELGRLLSPFLSGSSYDCILNHQKIPDSSAIALNKHDEVVAFATDFATDKRIIVVPQLADKAEFIRKLIVDFLPSRCPEFFPEFGSKKWVHAPEYELPKVLELGQELELARVEYEQNVKALNEQIQAERDQNQWVYDLLTESGDRLVSALKNALRTLGFSQVEDVDTQRDSAGQTRREDLQILDTRPTIIVDVKGLGSVPSDADIQQPGKHALMRIREWNRTDVISLLIVNHERNTPPLHRKAEPFRSEMVSNCEEDKTGLLTTWDLYRLIRGQWKHGWSLEHVKPLFYKSGRIWPVPAHYKLLGTVTKVFTPAFILATEQPLKVGDRVAWEEGLGFSEYTVESLRVSNQAIHSALAGTEVGIRTNPLHEKLKEGRTIYFIRS